MRRTYDQTALHSEFESLTEQLSFSVNRASRSRADTGPLISGQTMVNIVVDTFGIYIHGAHIAEGFADGFQVCLKLRQCTTARQFVILLKFIEKFIHEHFFGLRHKRLKALTLGPDFFHAFVEFLLSNVRIAGARALTELTAAAPVPNPI